MFLLLWDQLHFGKVKKPMNSIPISKSSQFSLIECKNIFSFRWSCYVRGLNNDEDISYYIKKVEFTLHPSFAEPIKTVEKFPFEIHQTGWGEFDIGVKIIFIDPAEKPVEMTHYLKLHPD